MKIINEVDCDRVLVSVDEWNRARIVLVHSDPWSAGGVLKVDVGTVIGGGVEFDPSVSRLVRFSPRVLSMIADEVERWTASKTGGDV